MDHINSTDPAIKLTIESTQKKCAIPILDTLVTQQTDNSLSITVYHKPTHTDKYLQWDSHHSLSAKCSVIDTLMHRVKLYALPQSFARRNLLTLGMQWGSAITPWAINKVQNKILNSNQVDQGNIQHNTNNNNQPLVNNNQEASTTTTSPVLINTMGQVVIPHVQGTAKVSNTSVVSMESRYTSRETQLSNTYEA